jgi:sugar-specific transcriptional regulator TrmB
MKIEEILAKIGLDLKETKVYLAVLELGETTVLPIAKKSGIQRTYCYDILNSLLQKGLVSYIEKRGRRHYVATDPTTIEEQINENKKQFKSILPELLSLYQKSPLKPRVRYYEGHQGIAIIHKEIIKNAKELLILSSVKEWISEFPEYIGEVKNLIKHKIQIKELSHRTKEIKDYIQYYQEPNQKLRYLPKRIKLANDIFVWGNKVTFISYAKELIAVVIESEQIAQTHRQIFNVLWGISKK